MLLGEPQSTQADLNFSLFGLHVRVSAFFWLTALVLGWRLAQRDVRLLVLWVAAVFVSILIHELGHAFAFRYFGVSSHIVLYHFGGLAIPDSMYSAWGRSSRSQDPRSRIIVSAAGPGIQLVLVACLVIGVRLTGHSAPLWIPYVPVDLLTGTSPMIQGDLLRNLVAFLLEINFYWALLNLMPIYPLDGGQIARDLFLMADVGSGIRNSLVLSVVTGAGIAIYAGMHDELFLAIMFGLLAFSSYQALQRYSGRGGGFGGGNPW